jgi:hypothetical protein
MPRELFASFLLGIPASGALKRVSGTAGMRWEEYSFYFQDTWKMTPKLTWTYGLRYELFTPEVEVADRMSNFDYRTGLLVVPEQGGSDPALSTRALVAMNKKNIQPRLGLAYQLDSKTVLRGLPLSPGWVCESLWFHGRERAVCWRYNYFNGNPSSCSNVRPGFIPTVAFNPHQPGTSRLGHRSPRPRRVYLAVVAGNSARVGL